MALIFDCSVREHPTIVRLVHQRRAVIVHLNWVCIFRLVCDGCDVFEINVFEITYLRGAML